MYGRYYYSFQFEFGAAGRGSCDELLENVRPSFRRFIYFYFFFSDIRDDCRGAINEFPYAILGGTIAFEILFFIYF